MAGLSFKNIYKSYENGFQAVKDFNLEVKDKEFVVFVGPSGCGKSTTLRMIAGLEEITQGELYIGDKKVNHVEPKDRDIAMVFQNYALYPQMTVKENMSYALRIAKTPKEEIDAKVAEAAQILGLTDLLDRKPKALSGGQRQRVALGRCIVRKPSVFLMDEPLSNLDAKLRVQTRAEITKLHETLEATFIYVTHDQTEAMTMADKIVIMNEGVIQQVDSPHNVYFYPRNLFVAGFIGSPQMNFIEAIIKKDSNRYSVEAEGIHFDILDEHGKILEEKGYLNKSVTVGLRPEHIYDESRKTDVAVEGEVTFLEMLGSEKYVYMKVKEHAILAKLYSDTQVTRGKAMTVYFDKEKIHFFDKESQHNIIYS